MAGEASVWRIHGLEITRVEGDRRLWAGYATAYGVTAVYEGSFDFWYRRRVFTQAAGVLKLKEPGEIHRDLRITAPVTAQTLLLPPALLDEAARALGRGSPPHFGDMLVGHERPASLPLFRLHALLARRPAWGLELESALAEALAALVGECSERPRSGGPRGRCARRALRARDWLHDRLAEGFGLDDLAREVDTNKFHLLRLFRREYGLPPYEYLTHLRVARARALLAAGEPAADVASAVGFYDQSQLIRHFRRIAGMTPGRYARLQRPGGNARALPPRGASQHRPRSGARLGVRVAAPKGRPCPCPPMQPFAPRPSPRFR